MEKESASEKNNQDNIYWHDAFYAALQLELHEYADNLIFEDEHQLSKEALKMDVLIVKKSEHIEIDKNIGRIFKGHNIFEYKSETDYLSIWDYGKVMGYAMLYSAFEEIPIENITVSFVVTPKPIKLLGYLEAIRHFKISEPCLGIYYVEGDTFPIQIIESKKLTANENIFLKNLRSSLTVKDMGDVFEAYRKYSKLDKVNIYLNRILDANKAIFEEVLAMSEATVQDIMYAHLEKNGTLDRIRKEGEKIGEKKGKLEGKLEAALKMIKKGFGLNEVSDILEMPVEWVQGLIK